MFSIDKKQLLKDFATAISVPVGLTDSNKWPVRAGTVIFPVRNIFVREFLNQIENSDILGNPQKWKMAFDGVSQLWRMSHHLINGLTDDKIAKDIIAKKILLLLEGISALCNENYFERIGNHIILGDSDVSELLKNDMIKKENAKNLLLLSGLLWAYSETNYFVAHELTCEYHGAYKTNNDTFAVIRDFKNLKPTELWDNRSYDNIPNEIRVVTIHNNNLAIGFDVYNNLFDEKGTLSNSLIEGFAIADNKILDIVQIEELISLLSKKVIEFTAEVNSMEHMEIAKKYMEVFWYRKKSLADYIGTSWKPELGLYSILEEGINNVTKTSSGKSNSRILNLDEVAKQYDFSEFI